MSMISSAVYDLTMLAIEHHRRNVKARATLREWWNQYRVDRLNAYLHDVAYGRRIPYDASIHEESLKNKQGRNPTTRIDLINKPGTKGKQGS